MIAPPSDHADESKFARVRIRCTPCGADYRPAEDRWTGLLSVPTQWAAYSAEVGDLGWRIRRMSRAPFDVVLHCPKCDAATAPPLEQEPVVGRHPG